jgi:hypothetical protein
LSHSYRPQPPAVVRPGTKPRGYDRDLEILASLALASPTPIETLAADFRCEQREVVDAVKRLARFGVGYAKGSRSGEGMAVIPRRFRDAVYEASERYWRTVHEHLPTNLN